MTESQFSSLGISDEIVRAITEMGFEAPTEIQEKSIPLVLAGRDVIGRSHTGTGKTAAFGIPAVERIDPEEEHVQVLVLSPTRELAMQSCQEIRKFSKYKPGIKAVPVYGGQPIEKQLFLLKKGANIVIGTPGRVMDHMRRRTLKLDHLKMIILDEADEMLNMGFREDIETILKDIPQERQTVLFSATMPPAILAITREFQTDPEMVEIRKDTRTIDTVEQTAYNVPQGRKMDALRLLLEFHQPALSIIFCNTKSMVEQLGEYLNNAGIGCEVLHGDMKQSARTQVMDRFKSRRVSILIATDVAARGIDVDDVDAVFNFDIPQNAEYYIHRIGRTGRAGKNGRAFTIFSGRKQMYELFDIQKVTGAKIPVMKVPTPESILERRSTQFLSRIKEVMDTADLSSYLEQAEALCASGYTPKQVAAAALSMVLEKERPDIEAVNDIVVSDRPRRDSSFMARLHLSAGRQQGMAPNYIVGAMVERTNLEGPQIGKIEIHDTYTTVEVPQDSRDEAIQSLNGCKINGRKVAVRLYEDRGPRRPYGDRGGFSGEKRYDRLPRKSSRDGGWKKKYSSED